jgi:hypothetical protein
MHAFSRHDCDAVGSPHSPTARVFAHSEARDRVTGYSLRQLSHDVDADVLAFLPEHSLSRRCPHVREKPLRASAKCWHRSSSATLLLADRVAQPFESQPAPQPASSRPLLAFGMSPPFQPPRNHAEPRTSPRTRFRRHVAKPSLRKPQLPIPNIHEPPSHDGDPLRRIPAETRNPISLARPRVRLRNAFSASARY